MAYRRPAALADANVMEALQRKCAQKPSNTWSTCIEIAAIRQSADAEDEGVEDSV